MKEIDQIIERLKAITGTKTDVDLAEFLEVPNKTLSMWKFRGEIPKGRLYEFANKLGVSMDTIINGNKVTGDGNVVLNGSSNNFGAKSSMRSPKVDEFLELYSKYGGGETVDNLLDPVIEKLRKIKQILEEE